MSKEIVVSQPSSIEIAERRFELMQRQATAMSKSELVPKEYREKLANCMIALEVADRVNASPLMVMQNLAIIHGRPSWSSTFIISAINSCGRFKPLRFKIVREDAPRDFHYEVFETEWKDKQKTTKVVKKTTRILNKTCIAWTTDDSGEVLESPPVSIEMACLEGWYDKSGSKWKTMDELMLRYRSAAFFGRLYAPDVLMGMHTVEEVEDMGLKDVTPKADSPVLANINDAIRKEAEKQKATDVDPETGEVIDQAAGDSSPPALSLQDWIDDIAAAPTAEGVDHKYGQASEQFLKDHNAMAQLTLAKTQRKQELAKPDGEAGSKTKKLFEKPATSTAA